MKKQLVIYAIVLGLIFTAGCASSPASLEMSRDQEAVMGQSAPAESSSFEADGLNTVTTKAEPSERMVIKDGSISIVVDDPSRTMDAISQMAADLGGFVVNSNLSQIRTERGLEVPQAHITIRVPAERMDEALEIIKSGAGRVLSENVSGQDVTQEYTDLASRLRNLESAESQLNKIMEEAQKTEDVLSVYNRLVEVQEEIEVIKGRMQYFERSAAMSSISVRIQANEAVQPLKIGNWQPVGVAKRAIQALINTLTFFGDALIWIVIYLVPVLLVLLVPLWLIWRGLKKLFRRKKADQEQAVKSESEKK
ncbi:MAG: DUF4349 domain-containing protein [Anaerolineales bacterium]|nr:DUF4349 domain-containing protein [Anaerolineales bacterium]